MARKAGTTKTVRRRAKATTTRARRAKSTGWLATSGTGKQHTSIQHTSTQQHASIQRSNSGTKQSRDRKGAVRRSQTAPQEQNDGRVSWLTVVGARQNNLKNITAEIPLGRFTCVTGVSGSGKSSLVNDIIRETLNRDLNGATKVHPGDHDRIDGLEHLDKVIDIDQSPIGRTPRSNPATYIKVFDEIRTLFAKLPDARIRGYKPGRFSFNVHTGKGGGGRCEACEGNGANKMEMELIADIWVTCPMCSGRRFSRETLQIRYKGKSIADVLTMDVQEALTHFEHIPKIASMLRTLHDVGLDYIKLGQSSTTLSGGEAQRIKLARELAKKATGRTLYILDEPTTGLHFHDIKKLLAVLHGFVDVGNSVIVIEHNLDVVKTADWVIDLGPEGGDAGGHIIAKGTPEKVAQSKRSYTGVALREVLRSKSTGWQATSGTRTGATGDTRRNSNRDPSPERKRRAHSNGRKNVISVVGARQHNLKNITVDIPRGKTTVCCGPSGSGKSSFAIDTVYTEGQRRYIESLSAYARQFLGQLQPPKVDRVDGLSPSVCIQQKNTSKSPRSTVGTVTEIYDYLRVLWARVGTPYCPPCKKPIGAQTSDEIVQRVLAMNEGTKLLLLAPITPSGNESYDHLLERERANGFRRVRVDGRVLELDASIGIDNKRRHQVELVVDRIIVRKRQASRIADSVEQTLAMGDGVLITQVVDETDGDSKKSATGGSEHRYSQHHSCSSCGRSYDELTPHHFSFNTRMGWCDACEGLGVQQGAGASSIVVHPTRSLADGAIGAWPALEPGSTLHLFVDAVARHIGLDLDTPWNELAESHRLGILHGCGDDWISVDSGLAERAATRQRNPSPERKRRVKQIRDRKGVAKSTGWHTTSGTGTGTTDGIRDMRFQWRGFFPAISRATRSSWQYRKRLEDLVTDVACDACAGSRLRQESAAVRVGDLTLRDLVAWPLGELLQWFEGLRLDARRRKIAGELIHEIRSRLRFLCDVGLEYLALNRTASTLSGGESQRIQLASQIGTGLTGVLYVLDEPTIGLHPRDNKRLIAAIKKLRDLGNTVLLVEHDREVIESADHVLDFGPGAGTHGGTITAEASPKKLRTLPASLTGQYLSRKKAICVPSNRRPIPQIPPRTDLSFDTVDVDVDVEPPIGQRTGKRIARTPQNEPLRWLTVHGARENNLAEIDVSFPLGRFTCVTGVSGSGKSTLVNAILYNALAARIHRARTVPGGHDRITGIEYIDKVINVDQSPIGNSPTSNPATYTGVFDLIRELFAKLPLSKIRGYGANRFSFNRPGGRCEMCTGMGQQCIEMHFLPDVWVDCENCHGARYVAETLEVQYRGKSIADVLQMPVSAALDLLGKIPKIKRMLQTLDDVGLGYVQLGQSAPTLSGGEAQRVKLAAELGRPSTGKTLYLLDEPTTGLHFDDLVKLLSVLHRLVDFGNTCICIEHNLDVIKTADWVVDLGPEAGQAGGHVVVEGSPEAVADCSESRTGVALAPILSAGPTRERTVHRIEDKPSRKATERLSAPLGEDVKMPWERDGLAWHTVDHVDNQGRPVEWDPKLLLWLVETIESLGTFAPTDWKHRSRVEITAAKSEMWFAHLLTGGKDLLDVSLRVPSGVLRRGDLTARLGVKTLDERKDLPIYGQWSRARVKPATAGWDAVRLTLRDFKDITKPKWRTFLKEAASAYLDQLELSADDPTVGKPWLTDGRSWHLGQRGIGSRHTVRWSSSLLVALIGRFKSLRRDLEVSWNHQVGVQLVVPGWPKPAGKIVTNIGRGLRVELRAPKNTLTPSMIDRLGEDAEIKTRVDSDSIVFWIRSMTQNDARQLRDVWQMCQAAGEEQLQSA